MAEQSDNTAHPGGYASAHIRVLGVDYLHLRLANEDDLYVTKFGVPFLECLRPENWREQEWFRSNREKLPGSSTVYRVRTKTVNGNSKDLVVKWCRVGQDVPVETTCAQSYGEFNSPFEEFSMVYELRDNRLGNPGIVRTHKPLAIYCPAKHHDLFRMGRKDYKFNAKKAKHIDIELDSRREYILVYEWIKGESVTESALAAADIVELNNKVYDNLAVKGYRVADQKPHHIIVRLDENRLPVRDRDNEIPYALIDFELLGRTPDCEERVENDKRKTYLKHQRDRFQTHTMASCPEHLTPVTVLGVPYIFGPAESTRGWVWVVGRDPELFDYFLPERWMRTKRERLSKRNKVYHSLTKDNIHLVWKLSRIGDLPNVETASVQRLHEIMEHGYNSPFEEFAIALELLENGVNAIYPRAIYMTEPDVNRAHSRDLSRYQSHELLKTPEGRPLLSPFSNYITLWGFWNGPDERLAIEDGNYVTGVNLAIARRDGLISAAMVKELLAKKRRKLERLGFDELNLSDHHILISVDESGRILYDDTGTPELRICNFDLIRRATDVHQDSPAR